MMGDSGFTSQLYLEQDASCPLAGGALDGADILLHLSAVPRFTGREFVVDGGFEAGPPWSRWPKFARMERPIRHHRPPDR